MSRLVTIRVIFFQGSSFLMKISSLGAFFALLIGSFICISCYLCVLLVFFFFSSRRRHTRCLSDWSSDVCSSDLAGGGEHVPSGGGARLRVEDLLLHHQVLPFLVVVEAQHAQAVGRDGDHRVGEEIGRASCRERGWGGGGGGP